MPELMVRGDLEAGGLVELDIPTSSDALNPLQAIWRVQTPPGQSADPPATSKRTKGGKIIVWRKKSYRLVAGEGLEPPTPGL
jgi:hypothetical protein